MILDRRPTYAGIRAKMFDPPSSYDLKVTRGRGKTLNNIGRFYIATARKIYLFLPAT
jgi:hypothetical protein